MTAGQKPLIACVVIFSLFLLPSCMSKNLADPVQIDSLGEIELQSYEPDAGYVSWGTYDLAIARDGSEWTITPDRSANGTWGLHLNVVKFLENHPCYDCLKIESIEVLPDNDLSVDISITHPFTNPVYTGFDVRGVIMFPASQYIPDNDLRVECGLEPYGIWWYRFSWNEKGDAQLMNPDGYTTIFAPEDVYALKNYEIEWGWPITSYYKGKMASGDELGTVNAFKRYRTSDTRHMFEAGKTDTRTYVIRPPSTGWIQASYIVYAHWAEPLTVPVTDPANDFGPEANSPMPYEFWIEQVGPVDEDAPVEVNGENIMWHIKSWDFGLENWYGMDYDILGEHGASNYPNMISAYDVCPDCYWYMYQATDYHNIPDGLPGTWPILFSLRIDEDILNADIYLATDWYIEWIDFEAYDGEW